ncbi:MAG: cation-translocating P-type ATPase, partial [Polyangiaceae bacterium]|nr:cation-translocating P-type ATPase [Polyangiaceae bacterium]
MTDSAPQTKEATLATRASSSSLAGDSALSKVPLHSVSIDSLLRALDVDPTSGLLGENVLARLSRLGKNQLPPGKKPSALKKFLAQFANPIVITLLVAAAIAIFDGGGRSVDEPFLLRYGDAIAILLIVALNAVLGFYQERRAEAALEALEKMQSPSA